MDVKEIKELLNAFDESGSSYLRIKEDGLDIKLKKPSANQTIVNTQMPVAQIAAPAPVNAAEATEVIVKEEKQPEGEQVLAPLVGVFYSAPSPDEDPYVQVGDKVKEGDILCLIEAMKMMSEITAPKDGVIKAIYAKNQDVVGFEEKLFLIGD